MRITLFRMAFRGVSSCSFFLLVFLKVDFELQFFLLVFLIVSLQSFRFLSSPTLSCCQCQVLTPKLFRQHRQAPKEWTRRSGRCTHKPAALDAKSRMCTRVGLFSDLHAAGLSLS